LQIKKTIAIFNQIYNKKRKQMKKQILIVIVAFMAMTLFKTDVKAQVGNIVGTWKTIDDETGKAKSHIKIFKATNGMYYGKIIKLLDKPADTKCTACTGSKKNKPIVGMIVVTKMKVDGKTLAGGKIMDPNNGKYYYCTLSLNANKTLNVRGSVDSWGWAGRNQTWIKLK